jgi:hypothetical protein
MLSELLTATINEETELRTQMNEAKTEMRRVTNLWKALKYTAVAA